MLISALLKFLWSSAQHWMVWVTGTGFVGFLLWLLSLYERKRGRPINTRKYALVLFCAFWFLATFTAWKDADTDRTNIATQLSGANSQRTTCENNLKLQEQGSSFWQRIADDKQGLINQLQSSVNQDQTTLGACVVSMAKNAQPIKQETTLRFTLANINATTDLLTYVAMTNIPVSPLNATFTCPTKFTLIAADGTMSTPRMHEAGREDIKDNSASFSSSLVWDRNDPIIVSALIPKGSNPWGCTLKLN
jgi:hypothetical protein